MSIRSIWKCKAFKNIQSLLHQYNIKRLGFKNVESLSKVLNQGYCFKWNVKPWALEEHWFSPRDYKNVQWMGFPSMIIYAAKVWFWDINIMVQLGDPELWATQSEHLYGSRVWNYALFLGQLIWKEGVWKPLVFEWINLSANGNAMQMCNGKVCAEANSEWTTLAQWMSFMWVVASLIMCQRQIRACKDSMHQGME